jgi:hypothetical protein
VDQKSGKKKYVDVDSEKGLQKLQVFTQGDEIKGKLNVKCSKPFEHLGVKLKLIGEISMLSFFCHVSFSPLVSVYDRGEHSQFLSQEMTLMPAGTHPLNASYDFDFPNAKLEHDSYNGVNAKLRYVQIHSSFFVRFSIYFIFYYVSFLLLVPLHLLFFSHVSDTICSFLRRDPTQLMS